jgi:hypothetical protein
MNTLLKTYKNLSRLSNLYTGVEDLNKVALQYQQTKDPILFSFAFIKLFPVMIRQVERYYCLTNDEKVSYCLEELNKSLLDFKEDKGAKLMTLFVTYLKRRLRTEAKSLQLDKRRADMNTESFDVAFNRTSYIESAYDALEYLESLNQMELTENELRYCEIVINSSGKVLDADIAKLIGISSAGVHFIKKSLAKKLLVI